MKFLKNQNISRFTTLIIAFLMSIVYLPLYSQTQSWKWIAYGDTRNNPPRTQHSEVLQSMVTNSSDYKFIINVGDVVDHGDVQSEWEAFYQQTIGILGGFGQDSIPPQYMAAPGNHDATETTAGLLNWNTYLPGQLNQFGNEGKYFTFDYENARFVILDSDKSSKTGPQYTMLLDAIQNNPKTWLFAIWHHPIFDFGEKSYQDFIHDTWGIPLYQSGCDIFFTGHAHYYVRSKKLELNGDKNPPLDPVNGTVQVVTGNGGAPLDIPDPNHDGNGYLVAAYNTNNTHYGYTEMTVGIDTLRLKHYLRDGTIFDEEYYTPNPKTVNTVRDIAYSSIPTLYHLDQNFPNPFNPSTIIKYGVPVDSDVTLEIFDILGRTVTTLVKDFRRAGTYTIEWNAKNVDGYSLTSGQYFYRFKADKYTIIRKMIIMQ